MKTVFMGTPDFAAAALAAIAEKHEVAAVFTRQDKPKGRGMKLQASPVKQLAQKLELPVYQPKNLREEGVMDTLKAIAPDVIIVAAYGCLLPKEVLELPRYGCLNIHASLLPALRGASPITAAILEGHKESGVSIMAMEEGLDTGAVYLMRSTPITESDTFGSLHDKLAELGAEAILDVMEKLPEGITAVPQPEEGVTWAAKVKNEDSFLKFSEISASDACLRIRAFDPTPGTFGICGDMRMKLFAPVSISDKVLEPGKMAAVKTGIIIGCKEGSILVGKIQPPGKKPMAAADFLRGKPGFTELSFE